MPAVLSYTYGHIAGSTTLILSACMDAYQRSYSIGIVQCSNSSTSHVKQTQWPSASLSVIIQLCECSNASVILLCFTRERLCRSFCNTDEVHRIYPTKGKSIHWTVRQTNDLYIWLPVLHWLLTSILAVN